MWFTPLLTNPDVVAGLRRATGPFLLAGAAPTSTGTAASRGRSRRMSSRRRARTTGMFVPGGLAASAAVLGDVMTAVERFLDDVAWPLR